MVCRPGIDMVDRPVAGPAGRWRAAGYALAIVQPPPAGRAAGRAVHNIYGRPTHHVLVATVSVAPPNSPILSDIPLDRRALCHPNLGSTLPRRCMSLTGSEDLLWHFEDALEAWSACTIRPVPHLRPPVSSLVDLDDGCASDT